MDIHKLKFPIGEFETPKTITSSHIKKWIVVIKLFPERIIKLLNKLDSHQLNWKYRPNSWSIKQVIHHCADSHMNSFIRFKLTLTEESPTIKPYFEDKWAEMPDVSDVDVEHSIKILEGLHARWGVLLNSLNSTDLQKEFVHPEHGKRFSIAENIGVYAWHCTHHLAHIKNAIEYGGKFDF